MNPQLFELNCLFSSLQVFGPELKKQVLFSPINKEFFFFSLFDFCFFFFCVWGQWIHIKAHVLFAPLDEIVHSLIQEKV